MKTILAASLMALACAGLVSAQIGKTFDWHTAAGDGQRSGWERSDTKFKKEEVKDFKLIYRHKFQGSKKGSGMLTAPVVMGTLIGYKGFKELGFLANDVGDVWALDVDMDRVYWERHIELPKIKAKPGCPGTVSSTPAMEPGVTFGPPPTGKRRAAAAAAPAGQMDMFRRIFAPRTLYMAASDGRLYRLDTSTGKDMNPPVDLFAAGANAASLNSAEGLIYTTTTGGCGDAPNAVWAADMSGETPKVGSFAASSPEGFVGRGGAVLGSDGTVYVQTSNTLQALSPKEMKLEQTFSAALGPTSPVVFGYKDTDLVVTAGKNGSVYMLDAKALDKVVYQTPVIAANVDHGLWGGLSTWQGADGTRWVLASVLGAVHGDLKAPQTNGDAPNGAIVAFKLTDQGGKLTLTPAWVSRDLLTPQAPVIANGVVFALSAGVYKHKGKPSGHATLFGFDGETGREIYSTGDQVTAPANLTGLTMANGRVFFSTTDSTLYAFGYHLEY